MSESDSELEAIPRSLAGIIPSGGGSVFASALASFGVSFVEFPLPVDMGFSSLDFPLPADLGLSSLDFPLPADLGFSSLDFPLEDSTEGCR